MKRLILIPFITLFFSSIYSQETKKQLFFQVKTEYTNVILDFEGEKRQLSFQESFFLDLIEKYNIQSIKRPFKSSSSELDNTFLLTSRNPLDERLVTFLSEQAFIEYVEYLPQYKLFYSPNDPLNSQQYNLTITKAFLAWDIASCSNTSNTTVVAVIDDAVLTSHPDLSASIWQNPNEIAGNGIDDDNNGFVDDVNGWDAANNDNDPNPPSNATTNFFSHGTHVAGIVGATTDNNVGIASIGFGVRIMPVKIGNTNTGGSLTGAFSGVDYAVASGYVDVANMSWGGGSYSQTLQNLITAGHNNGITWVAAAGNSNSNAPMYPASYQHVISVAATDHTDKRANFSNFGATIDVSAPGTNILSTVPGSSPSYDNKSGTSMAAPFVAGLAGLMKCYNTSITPLQIENCLESTADNIDAQNQGFVGQLGGGRVNAQAALLCLGGPPIAGFEAVNIQACPGQNIQFNDRSIGIGPFTYNWSFPGASSTSSTVQNPIVSYTLPGTYSISLTSTNSFGSDIESKTAYLTIANPTAQLSGNAIIVKGGIAYLRIDFTGNPPYDFVYNDGLNNTTVSGVNVNPYYIQVSPDEQTTYSLISMNDNGCAGSVSGSSTIEIKELSRACNNLFQKIINDNGETERVNICATNDGGYAISGVTTAFGQGSYDVFVNRFDSSDNLVWSKVLGTADNEFSYSAPIIQLEDSSFIIGCESKNFTSFPGVSGNLTYFKLDPVGNVVWQKRVDNNTDYSHIRKIIKDGNDFVFVGSAGLNLTAGATDDAYIMKCNGNTGDVLWSNAFLGSSNDHATSVLKSLDGGYYVAGSTGSFGVGRSATLFKYSSLGVLERSKFYDLGAKVENLYDMEYDHSNHIILVGAEGLGSSSDAIIWKMDTAGNVIWSKRLEGTNNSIATQVRILQDSTMLVLGYTDNFGHGGNDIFITKLDSNSNEIWTKLYGGIADDSFYTNDQNLILSPNQDYGLVTAYTESFGGSDKDAYLIKFSLGNDTLCNEIKGNFWTITNLSSTETNITVSVGSMPAMINASFIASNLPVNLDTICEVKCNSQSLISCLAIDTVQKVSDLAGNFSAILDDGDRLGQGVQGLGDLNGDGINDLAISAPQDDDAGVNGSAIYICYMNADGTVNSHQKIYSGVKGFNGATTNLGILGMGMTVIGDLNNDGFQDLAITETRANDGGRRTGAVWIWFMNNGDSVATYQKISHTTGGFNITFSNDERFGSDVAALGDLDGDGVEDIIVGSSQLVASQKGRVFILFLNTDGTVKSHQEIGDGIGGFTGVLDAGDNFGISVDTLGDVNGDGIVDVAVGARLDDDGGANKGAIWILLMQRNGTLLGHQKISDLTPGFAGVLDNEDHLGISISNLGDLDKNGINELLVGTYFDDDGGTDKGAAYILFLEPNLEVKDYLKISDLTPGFSGYLDNSDLFSWRTSNIGDLNNDGIPELAIGSPDDDDGGSSRGAVYIIYLADTCNNLTTPVVCPPFVSTDNTSCIGDSLQLVANIGVNYIWQPNYQITDVNIQNPDIFPERDTTYTVYYIDADNCAHEDTFRIKINAKPPVVVSPDSSVICINDSLQLTAFGADNYSWEPLNGLLGSNIANPRVSPLVSTLYVATGSSLVGCESIDSVYVEVLPCCGAYARFSASDTTICLGESIFFTNLSIVGNNPTLMWDFGPLSLPSTFMGANPPPVRFNQAGVYDVALILNDDCGRDTASLKIFVNNYPEFNIAEDTSVCGVESLVYALGDDEVVGFDYRWSPSTGLNSDLISNPIATVNATSKYMLTVTDEYTGCTQTDSVLIELGPDNISIVSPIRASLGERVIPQISGSADIWRWSPPTGLSCDTCSLPTIEVNGNITYEIVTQNQGCFELDSLEILTSDLCFGLPNVFTPNNDGINDYFYPSFSKKSQFELISLSIYNRWGHRIYNAPIPWDGRSKGWKAAAGVYSYSIEAKCDGALIQVSGQVILLR